MQVRFKIILILVGFILISTAIIYSYNMFMQEGVKPESETKPIMEVRRPIANYTPLGIHLSFKEDPSHDITFMWITLNKTMINMVSVTYPNGTVINYTGSSTFYRGWYWHKVYVRGLEAGQKYKYRVGDPSHVMSDLIEFHTAPSNKSSFIFTVYADQGTNEHSIDAVETALKFNPDIHLHPGDLSYGGAIVKQWVQWFKIIEPLASKIPYMIGVGNHEYDATGDLSDLDVYFDVSGEDYTYSFRYSNVFFFTINLGESDSIQPSEDTLNNIESLLESANKDSSIDWIIVFLHYPPFSSGVSHGSSEAASKLITLFDEYDVDLVFAGHEHNYERTYPLKGGVVVSRNLTNYSDVNGTIYLVVGGGGGGLYKNFISPKPEWSLFRKAVYSIAVVYVNGSNLTVNVVNTENEEIVDSFTILKSILSENKSLIRESGIQSLGNLGVYMVSSYFVYSIFIVMVISYPVFRLKNMNIKKY